MPGTQTLQRLTARVSTYAPGECVQVALDIHNDRPAGINAETSRRHGLPQNPRLAARWIIDAEAGDNSDPCARIADVVGHLSVGVLPAGVCRDSDVLREEFPVHRRLGGDDFRNAASARADSSPKLKRSSPLMLALTNNVLTRYRGAGVSVASSSQEY